ncbi:hypothetical protein PC129_g8817 [Phytophthora cactorum]|uniref:BZIP domain-containing protein n=1 Tax=Phytophthora cactorum TaxID=29920 RepID=A0A8T1GAA3_9STRA|nr:hypothetical protein PC111_g16319 [Phytophthora cactorum]KAG2824566.1 hypothetical protein PC112_g10065 [Phytophthora cactorum]KAG2904227.1 hypothetical protein PC115_g15059 [Phytophthora cactorum]KAG2911738.1 hypothetical protein PC114_g9252 [Phytophthora cactorum]KAG2946278.1 hypothetical protein PC117_g7754 [Phytophthora cactorum]
MTKLITLDEVLLDDIVGLLDFNGSLTPRLSTGDGDALTAALFSDNTGPASPSTGSDDSAKPNKQSRKREREKTRQRRYRQRIRDSRDELQRQVGELSKELLQLIKVAVMRKEMQMSTDILKNTSQWVSETVRQREQRALSEAEQKRLLAAVNYQASYIEGLRQVVGNRLNGNGVPFGTGNSFHRYTNVPALHSMTSPLYTMYLQQLEGSYARVDGVMSACGLMTMPETTINSTHRRKADGEVAYFQHVNKVVLPFSFHKRFVSRCYKEENRLVLVWKMSSEGQGDFRGLHAEETAWMSVRGTPTGVMMEVCVQQVPMRFNKGTSHEPATAMFHNVLHESLEADKNEMLRNLERLLLDDVLNGIEC